LRCSELGDEVAAAVLQKEGEDLAYLVCLVIRRLQAACGRQDWVPSLAFAGSIMEKVLPVRQALIAAVQREFPGVRALDGVVDPSPELSGAHGWAGFTRTQSCCTCMERMDDETRSVNGILSRVFWGLRFWVQLQRWGWHRMWWM